MNFSQPISKPKPASVTGNRDTTIKLLLVQAED